MYNIDRDFAKLQQVDGNFATRDSGRAKENSYARFGEEKHGQTSNNNTLLKYRTKIQMKINDRHQLHHLQEITLIL